MTYTHLIDGCHDHGWHYFKGLSLKPTLLLASHASVFRGARFSSLPREEIRAPLKTPPWEATLLLAQIIFDMNKN